MNLRRNSYEGCCVACKEPLAPGVGFLFPGSPYGQRQRRRVWTLLCGPCAKIAGYAVEPRCVVEVEETEGPVPERTSEWRRVASSTTNAQGVPCGPHVLSSSTGGLYAMHATWCGWRLMPIASFTVREDWRAW